MGRWEKRFGAQEMGRLAWTRPKRSASFGKGPAPAHVTLPNKRQMGLKQAPQLYSESAQRGGILQRLRTVHLMCCKYTQSQ
eukprot:scaffold169013_cov20-Tisochrysis_lutea.AAC.2